MAGQLLACSASHYHCRANPAIQNAGRIRERANRLTGTCHVYGLAGVSRETWRLPLAEGVDCRVGPAMTRTEGGIEEGVSRETLQSLAARRVCWQVKPRQANKTRKGCFTWNTSL